ncbi:DUF86 domain-containing protein [Patescibacteria group bacterium]|nr:DUF86 domain-containing protein [Patescibacteria group bacterium]MBU2416054.1 DUF86 domain-containing protein [Patescibacteria group bacterium]MBU2474454.1 DUF86 domain-containing protein [Patescibacteria group bacterium]
MFFMTAKYNITIHHSHLKESIKKLERYKKMFSRKTFLSDEVAMDAIRKALEETIEIMLTIGNMIIADNNFKKPERNDDIFDILANEKIYSRNLAEKLWGAGGFRNILAHQYIEINFDLVYDYLEQGIPVFKEYAKRVAKFI